MTGFEQPDLLRDLHRANRLSVMLQRYGPLLSEEVEEFDWGGGMVELTSKPVASSIAFRCHQVVALMALVVITIPLSAQQLKRKVYFVPLGKFQSVDVKHLMIYYQNKFGLGIEILDKLELEDRALNPSRNQYIAEELITLMQRGHPKLVLAIM